MIDNTFLECKLNEDINDLKKKINNYKLYNIRNVLMTLLLKIGHGLDYIKPYLLSTTTIVVINTLTGNELFESNYLGENASIEAIDTSNGIHLENITYDQVTAKLEYSTKWYYQDDTYKRINTSYKLNTKIFNSKKILSLSKEELETLFDIKDVSIIQKKELDENDTIYNEDVIIIRKACDKDYISSERKKINVSFMTKNIVFIFLCSVLGIALFEIDKNVINLSFSGKLNELEGKYHIITKDDLENLEKIIDIKEKNLNMLNSDYNDDKVKKLVLK